MKILFVLSKPYFLRYFDSVIEAALDAGHEVDLAFGWPDARSKALRTFEHRADAPNVLPRAPERTDSFAGMAAGIRAAADYVRYLDPDYRDADVLRARAWAGAVGRARFIARLSRLRTLPGSSASLILRVLMVLEGAIPSSSEVETYLRHAQADVVLVSPLVSTHLAQTDYVKSAQAIGVPVALAVASWDNLTNKGSIRAVPDRVIVWNEVQRQEAVTLHAVPPGRVELTGAHPFDRWFGRPPASSRRDFCGRVGLPPQRPYVLFLGSSGNIADKQVEEQFVRGWIEAIRSSDDSEVASLGVMIRPHPGRPGAWEALDLTGLGAAVVWPPPSRPVSSDARDEFFDSMFHAAVVVGINTSAMVEAAILGRPVLTVQSRQFAQAQEGTLHFRHLMPEGGGFVRSTRSLHEHVGQLGEAVRSPEKARTEAERFVGNFIRPLGRERSSSTVFLEVVERLAASRALRRSPPTPLAAPAVRRILRVLAAVAAIRRPSAAKARDRQVSRVLRKLARLAATARGQRVSSMLLHASREVEARGKRGRARRKALEGKRRSARRKAAAGWVEEQLRLALKPEPPEPID